MYVSVPNGLKASHVQVSVLSSIIKYDSISVSIYIIIYLLHFILTFGISHARLKGDIWTTDSQTL